MFNWGVDQSQFDGFKSDVNTFRSEVNNFKIEVRNAHSELREEIKRRASDSEESARVSAANASESANRIKEIESSVHDALNKLKDVAERADGERGRIQTLATELENSHRGLALGTEYIQQISAEITSIKSSIDVASAGVYANVDKINLTLSRSEKLPEKVSDIEALLEHCENIGEDIQGLLSHSMSRKSEVDDLHKQILGYDIKDAQGNSEHIDGLRDTLAKSYSAIQDRTNMLEVEVQRVVNEVKSSFLSHFASQKENFDQLLLDSKNQIDAVNEQLTSLLPGAMAEGLSAAYENKKSEEILSLTKFEAGFRKALFAMALVSLIPLGVDVYLLMYQGFELVRVIKDTPNLMVSILPLYFPILWFAHSSNKQLKLSKRLIEEYTHKAVLGKTFSGLSNQIESLPGEVVRDDLRQRLLFNLLQVSSENPGKLIKDFNKSDHPLMEALETSAKLSDSMVALSRVPGFSAIAKRLVEKSDEKLNATSQKVESGLTEHESLKGNDEENSSHD
jgi:predicted  nucleic acid-binding Zn-ribbon protein